MFVRNLLQAGDFVTLVPIGIPITLQYSEKGTLQKAYQFHDAAARVDLSNSILEHLISCNQVPTRVPIKGGTTWVQGVLYTEMSATDSGELPECVCDALLAEYDKNPKEFEFYAGNVESLAQKFNGPVAVRQWLNIALFKVLTGYLVSAGLTEDAFETMVTRDYPFGFPKVASYIVFRGANILYLNTGLTQNTVKDTKRLVDESGIITCEATFEDDTKLVVPYADVLKLNIARGTTIIYSSEGQALYSESDIGAKDAVGDTITCEYCGKKLIIPKSSSAVFKCSDPQCNSVLYPRVKQLLSEFELDPLSYQEYITIASEIGDIFSIPDLFDIEKYKDIEIQIPLTKAVRAVIPKSILPGAIQISQLCDACNNSVDTVIYYVQHLDKMKTELGLDVHTFTRLFKWLLNPENASDVVELLRLKNISYINSTCKFDGAPIFRDKTILITGTFKHGSLADITAILNSYSANVVTSLTSSVDCVLVGDIDENIKGSVIRGAQSQGILIMKETPFFNQYDIDEDLAANLK